MLSKEERREISRLANTWCLAEKIESLTSGGDAEYERHARLADTASKTFHAYLDQITES